MIYGSRISGLLYLSPYLLGLAVFTLFPFVASLLLSFSDYRLQDPIGAAPINAKAWFSSPSPANT